MTEWNPLSSRPPSFIHHVLSFIFLFSSLLDVYLFWSEKITREFLGYYYGVVVSLFFQFLSGIFMSHG